MGKYMRTLIKRTAGIAAVALAVKLSADNGVWSTNAEEGASLYAQLESHILPGTRIYRDELPSPTEAKQSMMAAWNRAVNCTFASTSLAAQKIKAKCYEWRNQIDIPGLERP